MLLLLGSLYLMISFVIYCIWVILEVYFLFLIVLVVRQFNGDCVIFDDFWEVYYWLQYNIFLDVKVMFWWDYGYQIIVMGN